MKNGFKKVLKIVIAGDGGIGKTTYLKYFCYNNYSDDQTLTVGNEIFLKKLKIRSRDQGSGDYYLQIWDCGGQERFRSFLIDFYRGSVGAILGFDMKRRKSFFDLKEWVNHLRIHNPVLPIVLIATKKDLGYHPTLNSDLGYNFASEFNLLGFVELSTKKNMNIEKPFNLLIQHIINCNEEDIHFINYEA
jgi:small GTP-binding protein